MGDFKQWETKFDKLDLVDFTFNREALLWLKLKSISKKEPQNDFLQFSGISPQTTGVKKIWCELFDTMKNDIEGSIRLLDDFSEAENQKQLSVLDIETLSNDLYKVQSFKWGGDHTNSLDKYFSEFSSWNNAILHILSFPSLTISNTSSTTSSLS